MQISKLQFKIQNYLIMTMLVFVVMPVFASEIFINSESQKIKVGEQFEVSIFLNAEEEYINAVEGQITFPKDLLILKEIREGNSIINFWVEKPKIESDNQVIFSGIIPGGYIGNKGLIFSAIFQSKNEGKGIIEIHQAKTLLNDGEGTETNTTISNLQFFVLKETDPSQISPTKTTDINPPEPFEPIISQDPIIFDGKYFLVFTAQDKGVGVDYYEVLEKSQRGSLQRLIGEERWQTGESPYLLEDQKLKSDIYIKAIDKVGNERITTLSSQNLLEWHENYFVLLTILLTIIITSIIWKRMRKSRFGKLSLSSIILIIAGSILPVFVFAADLYFSPATGSYNIGQTFPVDVYVSSTDQAINAVSGVISFPSDKLKVTFLSKEDSILNLWVLEPAFSNNTGTITFEGIILNPGFTGSAGKIININFEAKGVGGAPLTFSSSSALANDGKGTNILVNIGSGNYALQSEITVPLVGDIPLKDTPIGLIVSSPTHPDSEKWYSSNNPEFIWEVPENITGVKLLVDHNPVAVPIIPYSEPISEKQLEDLTDGIWYFHIQLQNSFGWGEISHYKFQIDTIDPLLFKIEVKEGKETTNSQPTLIFGTTDEISGIDYYEVKIDQESPIKIKEKEYKIPAQGLGTHLVIVKAVDRAGNNTLAITEINILPIGTIITDYLQTLFSYPNHSLKGTTTSSTLIEIVKLAINYLATIIIFLILILTIVFGIIWSWQKIKQIRKKNGKLAQSEKVLYQAFNSLKEEAEKQVAELDGKPGLSKREKKIYDKLKMALKKSEKSISKNIKDVEKKLP